MKKIELFLYKLLLQFYRLNDSIPASCDAIAVHGYELTRGDELSDATRQGVERAIKFARQFPSAQMFLISAILRGPEKKATEDRLKWEMLQKAGLENRAVLTAIGAKDTGDEAQIISWFLGDTPKDLPVICDAAQMRCARIIWRHFRPNDRLHLLGFEGRWDKEHICFFQRNPLVWLAVNFFRHTLLLAFGVSGTGKVTKFLKAIKT